MREMTNDTLRVCITKKLKTHYSDIEIRSDLAGNIRTLPAFFVRTVEVRQEHACFGFFQQKYLMEVRYHPDPNMNENGKQAKLNIISGELMDILQNIHTESFSASASNVESEVSDDVLVVTATYSIRKMIYQEQDASMQSLKERTEVI